MQLTPRYGAEPVLVFDEPVADPGGLVLRQRRRLEATLRELAPEAWAAPSRCEGWSVQDVIAHLSGTNGFWALSMQSGAAGSPTEYLATFDPVATPEQMVDPTRSMTPPEVLEGFVASNAALADAIDALDDTDWEAIAEAPPGHVPNRLVALHALWDSWVHERDIALPLGLAPLEAPDEIDACLRYVAGLGPAFGLALGLDSPPVEVSVTEPDVVFRVEVTDHVRIRSGGGDAERDVTRLSGPAVDVLEVLSVRQVPGFEVPDGARALLRGLAGVFDEPVVP